MATLLIVGLDAAADLNNFGYVVCRFTRGRLELLAADVLGALARVKEIVGDHRHDDSKVLLAIDAPLGWPTALGEALQAHQAGEAIDVEPNDLFRRVTDKATKALVGKQPLDVGADRIARSAWRALNVLAEFRRCSGERIPLAMSPDFAGRMAVIEVYPAATLQAWGTTSSGYKGSDEGGATARGAIGRTFAERAPWLRGLVDNDVNVFDAGLCAIAAADFIEGLAVPPGDSDARAAQREGWIWVRRPPRCG